MEKTYTVSVYATPMSFPLNFTVHTWIEITDGRTIDRYDFWGYPGLTTIPARGYIYKNLFPNHLGTTLSPFTDPNVTHKRQLGKIITAKSGGKGSVAEQLYQAIRQEALNYPHAHKYNMILGPNCNTYTNWLFNLVPEAKLQLPWYAWGKNYHL
ncbi:MAG: hypothetical protein RLZZ70_65 [Candidatus Parcubacteria bacterium]|jgi:hypothetical protein